MENARGGGSVGSRRRGLLPRPPRSARPSAAPDLEEGIVVPESLRIAPSSAFAPCGPGGAGDWRHARETEGLREEGPRIRSSYSRLPEPGDESSAAAEAALRRSMQLNPDGKASVATPWRQPRASGGGTAGSGGAGPAVARVDYRPGACRPAWRAQGLAAFQGGLRPPATATPSSRSGTAPHDAPAALPCADLRFSLGWYCPGG